MCVMGVVVYGWVYGWVYRMGVWACGCMDGFYGRVQEFWLVVLNM